MIMKKVECKILANTIVKNLQRQIEKPTTETLSSWQCPFDLRIDGNERREGYLLSEKRPRPRKRVMDSTETVPSAYLRKQGQVLITDTWSKEKTDPDALVTHRREDVMKLRLKSCLKSRKARVSEWLRG